MRPFYFGTSAEPLFGLHHPPRGARSRRCGVVVCSPVGQEYLRTHRALRQLAVRLSAAGFPTLRFDYFGCGDSSGEDHEGRLGRWVEDVAAAVEEAEALSGSPEVALVGLRLGATLAALLASRRPGVEALVLWDPVVHGKRYLSELEAAHEVWIREHTRPGSGAPDARPQILGFPLSDGLRQDLEAVDLGRLARCPARRALVLSTGEDEAPLLFDREAGPEGRVETERVPGAPPWLHGDGMDSSLVPLDALERVSVWLGRRCG